MLGQSLNEVQSLNEAKKLVRLKQQAILVDKELKDAINLLISLQDKPLKSKLEQDLKTIQSEYTEESKLLNLERAELFIGRVVEHINIIINQIQALQTDLRGYDITEIDKKTAKLILAKIEAAYVAWKPPVTPTNSPRSLTSHWQEQRLRIEQQVLYTDKAVGGGFQALLTNLKQLAHSGKYHIPTCFISYALPKEHKRHEQWIPVFLENFCVHLQQAGIRAEIERQAVRYGANKQQHLEKIKTADYVILIGTESLLEKHLEGISAEECSSLILIQDNRRADAKKEGADKFRVITLLLSGSYENSFPAYLRSYTAIEEFKVNSYLSILKGLVRHLYQASSNDTAFNSQWLAFESQYPLLRDGLTEEAVKDFIEQEAAARIEDQSNRNREGFALLAELNLQKRNYIPAIWNVGNRNPNFTGREDILEQLRRALKQKSTCAITQAVDGLGGIGKTQLVQEYAHRYKHHYQLVWWFNAENGLELGYRELAQKLGLPIERLKAEEIRDMVKNQLRQKQDWLLIFDDAQVAEELELYKPEQHTQARGHILIISRNPNWADTLLLDVFSREESIALLRRILNKAVTNSEFNQQAAELANILGDLPLALAQAGAYILQTGIHISSYIRLYQERQVEILKREPKPEGYEATVAVTWDISMAKIREKAPEAEEIARYSSFLASNDIPRKLFRHFIADELVLHEAIRQLRLYSMVTMNNEIETLSVHQLVQAVIKASVSKISDQMLYLNTIINELLSEYLKEVNAGLNAYKRLLPHIESVIAYWEQKPSLLIDDRLFVRLLEAAAGIYQYFLANPLPALRLY